jgi:glyoxylase-like metal-dependent hydrolase (beta-lactamase superfamily II)
MILKRVQVKTTQVNLLTNSYVICDEDSKEAMIIDPGGEPEKLAEVLDILGANLKYIFLTHCHADHIGGVPQLKDAKGGKILISRADAEGLYNPEVSLAPYIDMPNIELEAD